MVSEIIHNQVAMQERSSEICQYSGQKETKVQHAPFGRRRRSCNSTRTRFLVASASHKVST